MSFVSFIPLILATGQQCPCINVRSRVKVCHTQDLSAEQLLLVSVSSAVSSPCAEPFLA